MRTIQWTAVVALVFGALVTSGCGTCYWHCWKQERGPGPSFAPGVVQVQRENVNGTPGATVVAFATIDPTNPSQQWWLSTEPLPIGPDAAMKVVMKRYVGVDPKGQPYNDSISSERLCDEFRGRFSDPNAQPVLYDVYETWYALPCPGR